MLNRLNAVLVTRTAIADPPLKLVLIEDGEERGLWEVYTVLADAPSESDPGSCADAAAGEAVQVASSGPGWLCC